MRSPPSFFARRLARLRPWGILALAGLGSLSPASGAEPGPLPPEVALLQSINRRDLEAVKTMLAARPELVRADWGLGATPLHSAALLGHLDIVNALLERGADLNAVTKTGLTPLAFAAIGGRIEVAQALLERNARLTVPASHGSLLHLVGRAANPEQFRDAFFQQWTGLLLPNDVRSRLEPVFEASMDILRSSPGKRGATAQLLIERGVDPNASNAAGLTPLQAAALGGDARVVDVLLNAGAAIDAVDASGFTALNTACEAGNVAAARRLVEAGASLSVKTSDGRSPLYSAATVGSAPLVELLLAKGAEVQEHENKFQRSVLHTAALMGHDAVVRRLLDARADPKAVANDGCTPLHYAAGTRLEADQAVWEKMMGARAIGRGHALVIEHLLKAGAGVDVRSANAMTPLHYAANHGHADGARLLLEHGAEREARTSGAITPLLLAAKSGDVDTVRTLLEAGAQIDAVDSTSAGFLHFAVLSRNPVMVEFALERGANIELVAAKRSTALHYAALVPEPRIAELLVKAGLAIDAVNLEQSTALHLAARQGHAAVVKVLLDLGADLQRPGSLQQTALHSAALSGDPATFNLLLARGAKVAVRTTDQLEPLHGAAESGSVEIIKVLLARGARIDAHGKYQATPLHFAINAQRDAAAAFLIEKGAPIEAVDVGRQTALHVAAMKGNLAVTKLLLARSASVNARTKSGDTPLHFAVMIRQPGGAVPSTAPIADRVEIVRLLLAAGADRTATTQVGHTPFEGALSYGTKDLARLVSTDAPASSVAKSKAKSATPLEAAGAKTTAEPTTATGYSSRAMGRLARSDLLGALADCAKAEDIDPKLGTIWLNRGVIRQMQGDYSAALAAYDRMIALDPPRSAFARVLRFLAQRRLQQTDGDAQLKRAMSGSGTSWSSQVARFLLGEISEEQLDAAARQPAASADSQAGEAAYFAGMMALLRGDPEQAKVRFERSMAAAGATRVTQHLARAEYARLLGFASLQVAPGAGVKPDLIEILALAPTKVRKGVEQEIEVRVRYRLLTQAKGKIYFGFSLKKPDQMDLVGEAKIPAGSGELTTKLRVTPPANGDAAENFTAYVNLSSDPHPAKWTPVATAGRRLRLEP